VAILEYKLGLKAVGILFRERLRISSRELTRFYWVPSILIRLEAYFEGPISLTLFPFNLSTAQLGQNLAFSGASLKLRWHLAWSRWPQGSEMWSSVLNTVI
jgi:hypothetical protein